MKLLYILIFIPFYAFASVPQQINCALEGDVIFSWEITDSKVIHTIASKLGVVKSEYKISQLTDFEVKFNGTDSIGRYTVADLMWNKEKQSALARYANLNDKRNELQGGYMQNYENCKIK